MIYNNRLFNTRKELKRYLGGTRKYNIYQEESNNQPFAHNGTTIYDTDKRH